jgi:hypothetical protein
MELNKNTLELIKQHLGSRWEKAGVKPKCLMCGCETFSIQDHIYMAPEWAPKDPDPKRALNVPMIGIACNGCQLIMWISAIMSGVVIKTDNSKQTELKL